MTPESQGAHVIVETETLYDLLIVAELAHRAAAKQAEAVRLLTQTGPFERLHAVAAQEIGRVSYLLNGDESDVDCAGGFECALRNVEDFRDLLDIAIRPRPEEEADVTR
jgi:hypothetical protein